MGEVNISHKSERIVNKTGKKFNQEIAYILCKIRLKYYQSTVTSGERLLTVINLFFCLQMRIIRNNLTNCCRIPIKLFRVYENQHDFLRKRILCNVENTEDLKI